MEKATSSIRRGGAMLLSFGRGYQELNLIISELKNLKSHTKAVRDAQQVVLQDMMNWACNDENRALQELFVHLADLNSIWCEVQTQFAEQINEFRHQFEMILEGERSIDAARSRFSHCEHLEQKARKELRKVQKSRRDADIQASEEKVVACERQTEIAQTEVSEKIKENEAVKLIRVKEGLLKLSDAYLTLAHKCEYIFDAQRDIARCLPDVEDKEIHEIRYDGLSGAKDALARARDLVRDYRGASSQGHSQPRSTDPPPPYSPGPYYNVPFNPYYAPGATTSPNASQPVQSPSNVVYPNIRTDEDLAGAMNMAKI